MASLSIKKIEKEDTRPIVRFERKKLIVLECLAKYTPIMAQ